jgi:hypothetical protein
MKVVAAVWEQVYDLLVEDGQIAIGTLVAFVVTAVYAFFAGEPWRNAAGWLLFVLLMSLMLVNLYTTGRAAYAKRTDP